MTLRLVLDGKEIPVKQFLFPGGEVSASFDPSNLIPSGPVRASISASLASSDDVMALLMLTDAVRRQFPSIAKLEAYIFYVPYARQDRVMKPGESLSIKVFCDLINSQKYDNVVIWDPHSDVTPALLNNCTAVHQDSLANHTLTHIFVEPDTTVLVAPDAGAIKKISEVAKAMNISEVVRADKVRDPSTGKITGTKVYSEHIGDKDFLIVDDICDGGYTFLELAKVLRPLTNGKIILYVTHGIFSKGLEVFRGVIDEVYAANTFLKYPNEVELLKHTKPAPAALVPNEAQTELKLLPPSKV